MTADGFCSWLHVRQLTAESCVQQVVEGKRETKRDRNQVKEEFAINFGFDCVIP